ncbi:hypothetical protein COT42_08880 [Candidatus Saganbacteria bacterium CG08_land_8_20_14_0_20_45_16]|uniref:Uncharacterized protein n=1 Tax=Candidatus Saganbacteria bacterium CG08_land_8_20_14_0_20_45_16 TaxID=2014293 RepID=A0A2H0XT15_UNCSA|nr:MAG: hypothetical protein COT42_08880 [Candidatus Saganbacteria bacterium CG08_land_8_20_14_0_20_45_16]
MRETEETLLRVKKLLKREPNHPIALKRIAKHSLLQGNYRLALEGFVEAQKNLPRLFADIVLDFEEVIGKNPTKVGPRLSLVGFKIKQGELDAAILDLEEGLEAVPTDVESCNLLGRILVREGRIDEVISLIERSLAKGIKDVALAEILAAAYLEKGRINEAIKFYEEILLLKPADKQTLRILGDLYVRVEDFNRAAQSYQAMFSDDPEVAREIIQRLEELLKKLEGNIFIRGVLSDVYMRSLKPEKAVEKLLEIVRLDILRVAEVASRLRVILKNYPDHPTATIALAETLRRQGNFSESVQLYNDLVKRQPQQIEAAIDGYQEVLRFCPEQILARTYLAETFLYKNQVQEALAELRRMLDIDATTAPAVIKRCQDISKAQPQLLKARLVLGWAYLVAGDLQRAALEAEGILAIDNRCADAYLLQGEAYFKLKHCRRAVEIMKTALKVDPFNHKIQAFYRQVKEKELEIEIEKIKARMLDDQWRLSLHLDLAKLYLQKGLREEAIRELQVAQKDKNRAPLAANLLGCVYRGEGRFALAQTQFQRALELATPELAELIRTIRFNLGTTYEAQGQIKEALRLYEEVLQEDIDFGDLKQRIKYLKATSLSSMQAKAFVLVMQRPEDKTVVALWGREAKQGRTLRRADVSLSFGQSHNSAGFDYLIKGMDKAAAEEFQLAVQLDSQFSRALNNLAVSLIKEGKFFEAKEKIDQAINLEPSSIVLRNNLAVIYFMLGRFDQAKELLEQLQAIDPENSALCLNLGDLCYLKNDIRRAIELYQSVGSFDPLAEIAQQRLAYKTAN